MKFAFIILSSLFLTGCFVSEDPKPIPKKSEIKELKGEIFGSYYRVKYRGELEESEFQNELNTFFQKFNQEFSTYRPDSLVSQFNNLSVNQKLKTSSRFIEMLEFSQDFYEKTEGAFDPTLRPVIKLWGFGGEKSKTTPSDKALKEARAKVGFPAVKWSKETFEVWKTKPGLELDTNAFTPGWAADLIGKLLEAHGIQNYMVDISGEIIIRGEKSQGKKWVVGIERPSPDYAQGVQIALKIQDEAIATSGNYRQFYDDKGERRSHIIDPRTGRSVKHQITSASVIAPSAAAADAWSTAMMVLGEKGIKLAEKNGIKVFLLKAVKPGEFEEVISPSMLEFMDQAKL